jgi:NADH-quinone oxidoreductase subunit G
MPKLIIDDREIEVAAGTKVIEAAARLGIWIPRFCYHPALGSVGACRVCAVKFIQGPFKGVQMSCMIDAQDDMVVSTTDEEAVDFRRHVIEWLMLHHPHDCPVCDEGGHCLLQDMTVSGGHGMRRYRGKKRTYTDQYLGPLLQHEMNRCIHCYRCSRFYQEFSGFRDLGAMQSANQTYFGRFKDGVLESPFCGNLSDICPTGVYTDKPSRFFGRRWDYNRGPSICINCSLGCHTIASVKYREVKRQKARFSEAVNGHFICDRGRYGFFYSSLESRPRRASIDGKECEFDQAQRALNERVAKINKNTGSGAIAVASSARGSLETFMALKQLCRLNGWNGPAFFEDSSQTQQVKAAIARLEPQLKISLRDVERADFILVVGADPINEAPMLAMAMRQAKRNGADIVVLDPRSVALPFTLQHVPLPHDALCVYLGQLIKRVVDSRAAATFGDRAAEFFDALPDDGALTDSRLQLDDQVLRHLQQSRRPVIICNTEMVSVSTIGVTADFALLLQASEKQAGVFYLMPGANAFGGGMLSEENYSFLRIIEGIENGSTRALILAEADPYWHFPDRQRLEGALDKLDLLVVLDYLNSRAVDKAHVFLPTATIFETGGMFINQEGRVQTGPRAFSGGIPITQTGGGNHPPRLYDGGIPGSQPRAAWLALLQLTDGMSPVSEKNAAESLWEMLIQTIPELANYASMDHLPEDGLRLGIGEHVDLRFSVDWSSEMDIYRGQDDDFELLLVDRTFGTEELSSLSPCLRELEREPCLGMHADQAETMGLEDGDLLEIDTKTGSLRVELCRADNIAPGTLILPRHRALAWQMFGSGKIRIRKEQIRKAI